MAATNEVYELAVRRGKRSLNVLFADDLTAARLLDPPKPSAQSPFTSAQDLPTPGYIQTHIPDPDRERRELAPLFLALRALGSSTDMDCDVGHDMKIKHAHVKIRPTDKIVDSLRIFLTASRRVSPSQVTNAKFVQLCNPVGSVIIAVFNT
jgi:hypothetical protein